VAEVLERVGADLWGFQEVFGFQRRWLLGHGLAGGPWAHHGEGRSRCRRGEAVPVVWDRDRFGLVGARTVWFGPTPQLPGSRGTDAGSPRIATVAELWANRPLVVVNAHLDSSSPVARAEAAVQLVELVAERPRVPHLVMGDLNATLDDPELRPLVDAGLVPALPADAGSTATAFEQEVGRALDHVLLTPGFVVHRAEVRRDAGTASDHYPVVVELEVPS
jgi:endonuclease/exonuclease/phosphatase family metal-dependent hydrolase